MTDEDKHALAAWQALPETASVSKGVKQAVVTAEKELRDALERTTDPRVAKALRSWQDQAKFLTLLTGKAPGLEGML